MLQFSKIPFLKIVFLLLCLASIGCKQDRWSSYSESEARALQESHEVFLDLEFGMQVDAIVYQEYISKQIPRWIVGEVFYFQESAELDSARLFKSIYFDFSEWPKVKIAADGILVRLFQVGDIMSKKKGDSELINISKSGKSLSLFYPYRYDGKVD